MSIARVAVYDPRAVLAIKQGFEKLPPEVFASPRKNRNPRKRALHQYHRQK